MTHDRQTIARKNQVAYAVQLIQSVLMDCNPPKALVIEGNEKIEAVWECMGRVVEGVDDPLERPTKRPCRPDASPGALNQPREDVPEARGWNERKAAFGSSYPISLNLFICSTLPSFSLNLYPAIFPSVSTSSEFAYMNGYPSCATSGVM